MSRVLCKLMRSKKNRLLLPTRELIYQTVVEWGEGWDEHAHPRTISSRVIRSNTPALDTQITPGSRDKGRARGVNGLDVTTELLFGRAQIIR
jgi:hypothetical protein